MSDKQFKWDEFNKVLQGSSNICAGARKDIENAIKAGRGDPAEPKLGEVWVLEGDATPGMWVLNDSGRLIFMYGLLSWDSPWEIPEARTRGAKTRAKNVAAYLATGGKI